MPLLLTFRTIPTSRTPLAALVAGVLLPLVPPTLGAAAAGPPLGPTGASPGPGPSTTDPRAVAPRAAAPDRRRPGAAGAASGGSTILWPADSEAADVLGALGPPAAALAVVPVHWPAHTDAAAWSAPGPWSRWAESLVERGDGPEGRRHLATAALVQGRWESAWSHLLALAAVDPDGARALLPCYLPGVTAPTELGADGRLAPLPAGVRLAPALPPPTRAPGRIDIREVVLRDLRIGDGTLDLTVGVRGDGVEFGLEHTGGGPVELELLVPAPIGTRIENVYADWKAREDPLAPVPIRLEPGSEPYRMWARVRPATLDWPGLPVERLDARLRTAGLQFVLPADDPWAAEFEDLARGLERALGAPVATAPRPRSAPHTPVAPVHARVPALEARERWLDELVDAAERFVLTRADRPR